MGIDAVVIAIGDLTSWVEPGRGWRELERAAICDDYCPIREHTHIRVFSTPMEHVRLHSGQRYYAPRTEDGHWPTIYFHIKLMAHVFPKAQVYYTSDHDEGLADDEDLCTEEHLDSLWAHYLRRSAL
jgi:hypothetical protein